MTKAVNGTGLHIDEGGEARPDQEVDRAPIIWTTGSWTCPNCTTFNNPNAFPEGVDRESCQECGTAAPAEDQTGSKPVDGEIPIPDSLKALGATSDTVKALAGGLTEHAHNAAGAEQVENPNRKPADVPLPLDGEAADAGDGFERFNANKAMSTIIEKNIEVQASRDKYDSLKKQAAEAKKTLDQDEAALGRIISQFGRAREQQNSPQALLPLNGQPAAIDSNCPWERNNPGFPCPVCSASKKAKLNPDAGSAVHPEHDEHEDTATAAFAANVITPLIPKLKAKGLAITADELDELDADQLQALIDWTEQNGIVPPAILATSHVAAAPGTMAQTCANCEISLAFSTDPEGFYAEGERVGLDCDAKLEQVAKDAIDAVIPAEPAVEAARTPKSHAKKDGKKKREPEKERTEQVAAGKKKASPKSKAAKTGRGK